MIFCSNIFAVELIKTIYIQQKMVIYYDKVIPENYSSFFENIVPKSKRAPKKRKTAHYEFESFTEFTQTIEYDFFHAKSIRRLKKAQLEEKLQEALERVSAPEKNNNFLGDYAQGYDDFRRKKAEVIFALDKEREIVAFCFIYKNDSSKLNILFLSNHLLARITLFKIRSLLKIIAQKIDNPDSDILVHSQQGQILSNLLEKQLWGKIEHDDNNKNGSFQFQIRDLKL